MATPVVSVGDRVAELADASGLHRVHVLGWRDLADPEAGGSEVHFDEIATRWAAAGLEVLHRTSFATGQPTTEFRHGYEVVRRGGRMTVFPRAAVAELAGRHGRRDALVEIWNGVPWFSPLWAHGPRAVWLHHVHGPMWNQTLPPGIASIGRFVETRVAPRCYRRERVVTLAESSRRELVDDLGFAADRVTVVSPGISARYTPGGTRSPEPLVIAVGRLVPVKRFELLIEAMATVHRTVPRARLLIVGEGYERPALEALVERLGASGYVSMPGRIDDDALLDLYRSAWVIAGSSLAEGWGMTLTEAAACGTPAVVTDIIGHRDAVHHDRSGLVVREAEFAGALTRVLEDASLRERLSAGAMARAAELTWDAAAVSTMALLAEEAHRRRDR